LGVRVYERKSASMYGSAPCAGGRRGARGVDAHVLGQQADGQQAK
jgi:hypothetical protein